MSMTFQTWMATLDSIVGKRTGLSVNDLPDWTFRDAYEDELTPSQAASEFLSSTDMF